MTTLPGVPRGRRPVPDDIAKALSALHRDAVQAERNRLIKEAHQAGADATSISEAADVSRQHVYDVINGKYD